MSKVKVQTAGTAGPVKRVEAGVRAGGQFAEDNKAPGTTVLAGYPEADGQASVDGISKSSVNPKISQDEMRNLLGKYCTPAEFVEMSTSNARHFKRVYDPNGRKTTAKSAVEDIAQESMVEMMKTLSRNTDITDFNRLLSTIVAAQVVKATENVPHFDNRRAYRMFSAEVSAKEQEMQRSLSQVEQDKIAQGVLDNWPKPRHRPNKDFRTPRTNDISIYGAPENEGADIASTLVAPEGNGTYVEPGSFMDKAHAALETKGAAHKAEARRLAWNAFAESVDVPLARAGSLSQRQVTKHRSLIANYKKDDAFADKTDILAACEDWSNGNDNEATEALFAPFGELDIDGQEKIVGMLERFGEERAHTMWQGALGYANNKHAEVAAAA